MLAQKPCDTIRIMLTGNFRFVETESIYRVGAGCREPLHPAQGLRRLDSLSSLGAFRLPQTKDRKKNQPWPRTGRIVKAEDQKLRNQEAIARLSVAGYLGMENDLQGNLSAPTSPGKTGNDWRPVRLCIDRERRGRKHKCVGSSALNFIAVTRKGQKGEMISLAEESIKKRSFDTVKWPDAAMGPERGLSRLETVLVLHLHCDGHLNNHVEAEK